VTKILELRIHFTDNISNEFLNEIGENFQLTLPTDFESENIEVSDITFEIKEQEEI
jgi:hypothetical protein